MNMMKLEDGSTFECFELYSKDNVYLGIFSDDGELWGFYQGIIHALIWKEALDVQFDNISKILNKENI